jgi:hypothetical protein
VNLVGFHYKNKSQLGLYREGIAVFSETLKKYRNTNREKNVEFLGVKPGGAQSNH